MSTHKPFAVLNRTVNPLVRATLRSRAHRLFSKNLLLLTVTGKKSGREFTFPVAYKQEGDVVKIDVMWPAGKRWWRNLRTEAPVVVVLRGQPRTGRGQAHGDEEQGVRVDITLDA